MSRSGSSWYLRLERRGDVVTGAISEDGTEWGDPQTIDISDFPKQLALGVAVCSTSKAPVEATFDSLTVSTR